MLQPRLVAGGWFTVAGGAAASNIAAFDPAAGTWEPLGQGVNGWVYALTTLSTGELVAGGSFQAAGGVAANHVAIWNGTSWAALGSGVDATVSALASVPGGGLIAGGSFQMAGGLAASCVASWDGATWSPLGTGVASAPPQTSHISALARTAGGDFIAGGQFSQAGGIAAANIARWNGSTWSPLGTGTNGVVTALAAMPNGSIAAGGSFTLAGGVSCSNIARWSGTSWNVVGPGTGVSGSNSRVNTIVALSNNNLLVGGSFSSAGPSAAGHVARWSSLGAWSALGSGTNSPVAAIAAHPTGGTFAAGGFNSAGGLTAFSIARWDSASASWSAVSQGTDGHIYAIQPFGGTFAVGGRFTQIGGTLANGIALRTGNSWTALGAGLGGRVQAMAVLPSGNLLAGGADGSFSNGRVRRWDGTSWFDFGTPLGSPVRIYALAVMPNGDLIAGGDIPDGSLRNIARWNGSAWQSLSGGLTSAFDNPVRAILALANGHVIAGGSFTSASGAPISYIAEWNTAGWVTLGPGLNGPVHTLAQAPNGDTYAGGSFLSSGSTPLNYIARWDGATWTPLGTGLGGTVLGIALLPSGQLIAAGEFQQAGGAPAKFVARWDGATWHPIESGTGTTAYVATYFENSVLFGGDFQTAGGLASAFFARLDTTCPAATTSLGTGCASSGGANLLAATSLPFLGSSFGSRGTGLPVDAAVAVALGFSPLPSPVPLDSFLPEASPGCNLLVSPDIIATIPAFAGVAELQLALPLTPSLAGQQLFEQMVPLEFDSNMTVVAITSTNALAMTLGFL